MESIQERVVYILDKVRVLELAPPGPPPRPGLDWKEKTHRWIRPQEEYTPQRWTGGQVDVPSRIRVSTTEEFESGLLTYDHFRRIAQRLSKVFIPESAPSYVDISIAGSVKNLDRSDLKEYQAAAYDVINGALRKGEKMDSDHQKVTEAMIRNMHELEEPQLLYRGMWGTLKTQGRDAVVGDEVDIDAFMSCSRDPSIAMGFSEYVPEGYEENPFTFLEIDALGTAWGMTWSNRDTSYAEDERF